MNRFRPFALDEHFLPWQEAEAHREIVAHLNQWAIAQGIITEEERPKEWWEEEF